jgi:hypothetical protein
MIISGLFYLVLLFILCFAFVILLRLAYMGIKYIKKPSQPKQTDKKAPQNVYYIVEKKRAKRKYSNPKEIEFK